MAIKIRNSEIADIKSILDIFKSAKSYMRKNKNFSQWNDNYPGESHIREDIKHGNSYVGINEKGEIVMTFAFILGEDPTYLNIREGKWMNNEPYGTIHRLASNGEERGVLKAACDYCFTKTNNIRLDTHESNLPMQKAVRDLNFVKCGVIICRDGSPRIAFLKSLQEDRIEIK